MQTIIVCSMINFMGMMEIKEKLESQQRIKRAENLHNQVHVAILSNRCF